MKTIILTLIMSVSLSLNAQTDSTQTDTVKCLETRLVVHSASAAFIVFFTSAAQDLNLKIKELFRKEDHDN